MFDDDTRRPSWTPLLPAPNKPHLESDSKSYFESFFKPNQQSESKTVSKDAASLPLKAEGKPAPPHHWWNMRPVGASSKMFEPDKKPPSDKKTSTKPKHMPKFMDGYRRERVDASASSGSSKNSKKNSSKSSNKSSSKNSNKSSSKNSNKSSSKNSNKSLSVYSNKST
jgi:hypothetical protein